MATWRMRIARWVTKDTNTHSEYVILIALPPQQRFHESASLLRHILLTIFLVIKSFRKPIALLCSGRKYKTDLLHLLY